jgi:hypothetical protein
MISYELFIKSSIDAGMSMQQAEEAWERYQREQGQYAIPDKSARGYGTLETGLQPDAAANAAILQRSDFNHSTNPQREVAIWQAEQDAIPAQNRRAIEAALAGLLKPNSSGPEQWNFGGRTFEVPAEDAGKIPESRWGDIQAMTQQLGAMDVLEHNRFINNAMRDRPEDITRVNEYGITLVDPSRERVAEINAGARGATDASRERMAAAENQINADVAKFGLDVKNSAQMLELADMYGKAAGRAMDEAERQKNLDAQKGLMEYIRTKLTPGAPPSATPVPGRGPSQGGSYVDDLRTRLGG